MSTAQKITSFVELPLYIKELHHKRMAISHDIMQLQNLSVHCTDVNVLSIISHGLIDLIKNLNDYDSKNTENSSIPLESN